MDKLELLEALEDLENGTNAARIAASEYKEIMSETEWTNAKEWIFSKLLEDFQTLRTNLMEEIAEERQRRMRENATAT